MSLELHPGCSFSGPSSSPLSSQDACPGMCSCLPTLNPILALAKLTKLHHRERAHMDTCLGAHGVSLLPFQCLAWGQLWLLILMLWGWGLGDAIVPMMAKSTIRPI